MHDNDVNFALNIKLYKVQRQNHCLIFLNINAQLVAAG